MKNVVIISSSMRKGNSDKLCDEFEKGVKENKNNVTRINIRNISLKFCISCCDCYSIGKCTLNDDMNSLYETIKNADVLVFATPIYFGDICGQLKVFLDRLYPIYQNIKASEAYIIATCYQDDKTFIDDSIYSIKRFLEDAGDIELKNIIYGENTDEVGDVSAEQCNIAYSIGKIV